MKLTFEKAVYALIYLPLSLLAIIITELVFFIVKQMAKITAACKRNKVKKILSVLLLTVVMISCNVQKPLHQSGPYVIEWRHGNLSRLQGVRGIYEFVSDTLKVGDTIQVTMMYKRK